MAAYYKNITDNTIATLIGRISSAGHIARGTKVGNPGSIKSILITNAHDSTANKVWLYYEDVSGNKYYIIETTIPAQATLLLDHNVAFDAATYALMFKANEASGVISIIIK